MSDMDCETCPSTSPLQVVIPETKEMSLTITEKAKNTLLGVMGDDSESALLVDVLSGGCSGYKYDLQIIEPLEDTEHFGLLIDGIQVWVNMPTDPGMVGSPKEFKLPYNDEAAPEFTSRSSVEIPENKDNSSSTNKKQAKQVLDLGKEKIKVYDETMGSVNEDSLKKLRNQVK